MCNLHLGRPGILSTIHAKHLELLILPIVRLDADPFLPLLLVDKHHEPSALQFAHARQSVILQGILFHHLGLRLDRRHSKGGLAPEFRVAPQGLLAGNLRAGGSQAHRPPYQRTNE